MVSLVAGSRPSVVEKILCSILNLDLFSEWFISIRISCLQTFYLCNLSNLFSLLRIVCQLPYVLSHGPFLTSFVLFSSFQHS